MNPNGIACYPKSFRATLVSEKKICLQFNNPQVKLRKWSDEGCIKLPSTEKALPLTTSGIDMSVIAVGCPLETIIELKTAIDAACQEHAERFPDSPFKKEPV
jgi:hypothetical protein